MAPPADFEFPFEAESRGIGWDEEGWYHLMGVQVDIIGFSQRKIAPAFTVGKLIVESVAELLLGEKTVEDHLLTKVRINPKNSQLPHALACGNRRLCALKTYQAVSRAMAKKFADVGIEGVQASGVHLQTQLVATCKWRHYNTPDWCGGHSIDNMTDRGSVAVQPGGTGGLSRAQQQARGAVRVICAEELSNLILAYIVDPSAAASSWRNAPFLNATGAEVAKAKLITVAARLSNVERRSATDRARSPPRRLRSRSRSPRR